MDPKSDDLKIEDTKAADAASASARSKAVSDEKSEARELWFKTVVKVLKWKEGKGKEDNALLTEKEWNAYYKETIKINTTTKDKTLKKLKETEELIKKHGGFGF
jgi:uncharacterized protein (DUF885 family)